MKTEKDFSGTARLIPADATWKDLAEMAIKEAITASGFEVKKINDKEGDTSPFKISATERGSNKATALDAH